MGKRINNKELLIVATNSNEVLLEEYSKRWAVENMFSCLKTRGFNLETTKVKENYKLEKLVAILSIAYSWCIITGKHYRKKDSRYRKDLGCYSKSIFKIGFDRLNTSIFKKHLEPKEYERYCSLFSPSDKLFM